MKLVFALSTFFLTFLSFSASADLVYLYPVSDGSMRLVSFALERTTVQVTISRTFSNGDPQRMTDEINTRLGEIRNLAPRTEWSRTRYLAEYGRSFPMVKSYSVPVGNFSRKLAEVLDEKLVLGSSDLVGMAFETMNAEEKLDEVLVSTPRYEWEGLHEGPYSQDLQRYLLKQAASYQRHLNPRYQPERDISRSIQQIKDRVSTSPGGLVHAMDDVDLDLLVSSYEIAYAKILYIDRMYRAMEQPYPYLQQDLADSIEKGFKATTKFNSAWVSESQKTLKTEGRFPIWAIDREMNVLQHLR